MTQTADQAKPTVRVRPGLLEDMRKKHNFPSEAAQAAYIGIERTTLRRLQRGDAPSPASLASLHKATGLDFNKIIEPVNEAAPTN